MSSGASHHAANQIRGREKKGERESRLVGRTHDEQQAERLQMVSPPPECRACTWGISEEGEVGGWDLRSIKVFLLWQLSRFIL